MARRSLGGERDGGGGQGGVSVARGGGGSYLSLVHQLFTNKNLQQFVGSLIMIENSSQK